MWLVCAGGKRSGSTLQYNIIAALVESTQSGKRITHFNPKDFPNIKDQEIGYTKYKVIKSHLLTAPLAKEIENGHAKVFHSFRDIRDVVVSAIHKGWIHHELEQIKVFVEAYLQQYKDWQKYEDHWLSRKYEDFAFNIEGEIQFLANSLGLAITEAQLKSIAASLDIEHLKARQKHIANSDVRTVDNQTFDTKTLLHTNHINDGSAKQFLNTLKPQEIVAIEGLAHTFLLENGYASYWPKSSSFLSFSQHADDYMAWQLLGKKSSGTVVEIGAFDGKHLSNSYSLEQLGWKSICVEPSTTIYKYLKENRPNSITVNKAVVGDENIKEITFYSEEIGVLSGVVYDEEDVKRRYKNRGLAYKAPKKTSVPATTLNTLFAAHEISRVDVLSIDVEGYEVEVLNGLDLSKIKVGLFIIEANDAAFRKRILQFFEPHKKYVHIGSNFQNLFILNKEYAKKKHLKSLRFEGYIPAKQEHPLDTALVIDSVPPSFEKTKHFDTLLKPFNFF